MGKSVLWRGKDGHNIPVMRPSVAIHDKLMRPRNQSQAVVVVEGFRYILAECVACSSWGDTPTASVVRIGPKQIAHWTFMRHFLEAINGSNVVKGVYGGGKAAVKAEDLGMALEFRA